MTNALILCKEIMAVCGYSYMGHVNIHCDQNFGIHSVKSEGTYSKNQALTGQLRPLFSYKMADFFTR